MTTLSIEESERPVKKVRRVSLPNEAIAVTKKREAYDKAKKKADELERVYKVAQQQLKDHMEAEGVSGLKVGDINYVPAETTYASVQDIDALIEWVGKDKDRKAFLKTAANKEALNEEVRRLLEDGESPPPGVGFYVREYVSQRAA